MTEKTFWRTVRKNGQTGMIPADRRTAEIASGWHEGETRGGKLSKARNLGFHRLMHAIGGMASHNLDAFEGMGGHQVLKRLQVETGVECDEVAVRIGGHDMIYKIPRSLSFDTMDDDTFKRVSDALCWQLIREYDFGESVEEIKQMAQEHERSAT